MSPFDIDVAELSSDDSCDVATLATTTMGDLDGALGRIAAVIATANPTHGRAWRGMRSAEHVARALKHVIEWQVGPDPENIEHAACRLLMGLQLELETQREPDLVGWARDFRAPRASGSERRRQLSSNITNNTRRG